MTEKQNKFIREYLKDFNATRSAIAAGYSEDTAYSIGWENLRKPEIRDAIQKYIDDSLQDDAMTLKRRVADELSGIAFADNDEIGLNNKLRALELLGKYQSMFTDKQEIEHSGQVVYLPPGADAEGF